jgi:hypothetical protein
MGSSTGVGSEQAVSKKAAANSKAAVGKGLECMAAEYNNDQLVINLWEMQCSVNLQAKSPDAKSPQEHDYRPACTSRAHYAL